MKSGKVLGMGEPINMSAADFLRLCDGIMAFSSQRPEAIFLRSKIKEFWSRNSVTYEREAGINEAILKKYVRVDSVGRPEVEAHEGGKRLAMIDESKRADMERELAEAGAKEVVARI